MKIVHFVLLCALTIASRATGLNVSSPLESKMTNDNASEEVIYIGTVVRHGLMTRKLFMVTFVTNLHALSSAHSIKDHRNEKHNLEVHIKNKPSSFKIDDMVAYRKYSTNSRDNFNIGVITLQEQVDVNVIDLPLTETVGQIKIENCQTFELVTINPKEKINKRTIKIDLDDKYCQYKFENCLYNRLLCGFAEPGKGKVHSSDDGSPLVHGSLLVGILTSYRDDPDDFRLLFTFVYDRLDFILEQIVQNSKKSESPALLKYIEEHKKLHSYAAFSAVYKDLMLEDSHTKYYEIYNPVAYAEMTKRRPYRVKVSSGKSSSTSSITAMGRDLSELL